MTGISLYNLIANEYRDLLFLNTVDMMNTISRRIEWTVIDNTLPVDFYAGFQRFSFFLLQQERFERLANVARRIYIFGIPDVTPPIIPGIEFIPIDEESNLALEWFLVINASYFYTALLTREVFGQDEITGKRRFSGIWTHDEVIVEQCNLLLSQFLNRPYMPIHQRDYSQQNTYIIEIANKLVLQLEKSNLRRSQSQRLSEAIGQIAKVAVTSESQEQLLESIVTSLRSTFKARTVTIWNPAENESEMVLIAAAGLPRNWQQAVYRYQPINDSEHLSAQVFQNAMTAYIPDTELAGRPDPFDPAVRSVLAVPLMAQKQFLGVVQVTDHRPEAYSAEVQVALESIGAQIALARVGDVSAVEAIPNNADLQNPVDFSWTIFNSTLDGIILLSQDKSIRFLNSAAYTLFKVDETQVIGSPIDVLGQPELIEMAMNLKPDLGMLYAEFAQGEAARYTIGASPLLNGAFLSNGISGTNGANGASTSSGWIFVIRKQEDVFGQIGLDSMSNNVLVSQVKLADEISKRMQEASNLIGTFPSQTQLDTAQSDVLDRVKQLHHETREVTKMFSLLSPIDETQDAPDKILQKLLLVDQAQSGEDEFSLVDVNLVVQDAVKNCGDLAATRNVTLVNKLSDRLPFIEANETQLRRALVELIDNAIRYNPPGLTVVILAHSNGQCLTVAVQDKGMGLWPKDIPFLFELFFRVRNPQTLKEAGKGIGLALVKAVAIHHQGRAWVNSKIGKGSTFLVEIPIKRKVNE
ncbi:MAG: ATP-binding protein [Chloroflexota bacterium]